MKRLPCTYEPVEAGRVRIRVETREGPLTLVYGPVAHRALVLIDRTEQVVPAQPWRPGRVKVQDTRPLELGVPLLDEDLVQARWSRTTVQVRCDNPVEYLDLSLPRAWTFPDAELESFAYQRYRNLGFDICFVVSVWAQLVFVAGVARRFGYRYLFDPIAWMLENLSACPNWWCVTETLESHDPFQSAFDGFGQVVAAGLVLGLVPPLAFRERFRIPSVVYEDPESLFNRVRRELTECFSLSPGGDVRSRVDIRVDGEGKEG